MYVIRFVGHQRGYSTPKVRVFQVVKIGDRAIWGVDPITREFEVVNRSLNDGSARSFGMQMFDTYGEAELAAAAKQDQLDNNTEYAKVVA